jgi:DNA repair protein SbcD/Mre11
MKIIHTSDWHLGRVLNGISLLDDQKYILEKLIGILINEKPDVLLIAGDIFDRSVPSAQAVLLLNDFINKIVFDLKIKTIIISGNHDSAERLNFGSKIFKESGFFILSSLEECTEKITLKDTFGNVNFWTIPYFSPALIKNIKNDEIRNHDDAFKTLIGEIKDKIDISERNILITHAFVAGGEVTEESEVPLSVGGSEQISVELLKMFDYVALGHLHRPQKVGSEKIRYSGSILQYSFSEVAHKKCVYKIEIEDKKNISISEIFLKPEKPLREIKGQFDEIYTDAKNDPEKNDYLNIILTDTVLPLNPKERLREYYPNIIQIGKEFLNISSENKNIVTGNDLKKITDKDLILRFYKDTRKHEFEQKNMKVLDDLISEFNKTGEAPE